MTYRTSPGAAAPRRRLDPRASGLRHLRWTREVLGTLLAHHEHDARLDADTRAFVLARAMDLRAAVDALSARVKPYRDFLERARTRVRGNVRVGEYLVATARTREEQAEATTVRDGMREALANFDARERGPLKVALTGAVAATRAHLEALDAALEPRVGAAFVESLYPELDEAGLCVLDDGDPDDDSSA
ncbi:MAG TPA: hypothetical protein VGM56_15015 [Byssovorax sp.]